MPIEFNVDSESGYFVSRYFGHMTDAELIPAWAEFLERGWRADLDELADLSEADFAEVSTAGVQELARFTQEAYEQRGVTSVLVAVYAPSDLPFGLARVYQAMVDESPESLRVFTDRQKAELWLKEQRSLLDRNPAA